MSHLNDSLQINIGPISAVECAYLHEALIHYSERCLSAAAARMVDGLIHTGDQSQDANAFVAETLHRVSDMEELNDRISAALEGSGYQFDDDGHLIREDERVA